MSGNRDGGEADGRPPRRQRHAGDRSDVPSGIRFAGVGTELAASTLVLGGIGLWIDRSRGHETPYLTIAGALVGFAVGMYRLIRLAVSAGDEVGGGASWQPEAARRQDASSGTGDSAHATDESPQGRPDEPEQPPPP